MIILLQFVVQTILRIFQTPQKPVLENFVLRPYLAVLNHTVKTRSKSMFWVMLLPIWSYWSDPILLMKPETVVRWYQQGEGRNQQKWGTSELFRWSGTIITVSP